MHVHLNCFSMGFTLQHINNNSGTKLFLLTLHYEPVSFRVLCHPYNIPTFKTNTLHLVSNQGQLKCLLLLYKWIILVFFGCNWWCIVLLGPRLSITLMDKMELKSSLNCSTNHIVKITPLVIYGLGGIHTHSRMKLISRNQVCARRRLLA